MVKNRIWYVSLGQPSTMLFYQNFEFLGLAKAFPYERKSGFLAWLKPLPGSVIGFWRFWLWLGLEQALWYESEFLACVKLVKKKYPSSWPGPGSAVENLRFGCRFFDLALRSKIQIFGFCAKIGFSAWVIKPWPSSALRIILPWARLAFRKFDYILPLVSLCARKSDFCCHGQALCSKI